MRNTNVLFPIGTDAPLYHRPIGTVLLLIAYVAVFVATNGARHPEAWGPHSNTGFGPDVWVSSTFFHIGVGHLIGNLIFLWSFGLIVEGKIGTLRFLSFYFAVCLSVGLWMKLSPGHSGNFDGGEKGNSAAIYALMAISLIWAPMNNFEMVWFNRFGRHHAGTVEVSVLWVSLVFLILETFLAVSSGFRMGSAVVHLSGAAIGAAFAIVMLRKGWVDCEDGDLFTVWKRDVKANALLTSAPEIRHQDRSALKTAQRQKQTPEELNRKLLAHISAGNFKAAHQVLMQLKRCRATGDEPRPADLRTLIRGLAKDRLYPEAAWTIEECYLPRSQQPENKIRLFLASILVSELHRPREALRQLTKIDVNSLLPDQKNDYLKVQAEAQRQIDDGVVEIAPRDHF
ncbi:rhomboid family intramembrane serine protease [Planctomicrobium sp. SH661]|uniref:rhomboid family intramembrane serine protease n=1 Tax=Planctomicrobium sp. SH661 TaxID=3448124 RepID=UPI003F5B949A